MKRRPSIAVAAALVLAGLVIAAPTFGSGAPGTWEGLQGEFNYRLYKPTVTLGFKLNKLMTELCQPGTIDWVAGTYGTYKGVLGSNTKGFALYEGHPICSYPGESTKILGSRRKVMGVSVYVGVYCTPPKKCGIAQGYKNGFTLQWKAPKDSTYQKRTQMQLVSAHLTFTQVLKIANGLKAVSPAA